MSRIIREALGPWFKAEGYTRTKNLLGWTRPLDDQWLTIWVQLQQAWRTDPYAGSALTVEFQIAGDPRPGTWPWTVEERIWRLLSPAARIEVRQLQNAVIARLALPGADCLEHRDEAATELHLAQFQPATEDYDVREDVWFRYFDAVDVTEWAQFLLCQVPDAVATILTEHERKKVSPLIGFVSTPERRVPMVRDVTVAEVARLFQHARGDVELVREALHWLSDEELDAARACVGAFPAEVQEILWTPEVIASTRGRWSVYGVLLADDPPRARLRNSRSTDVAEIIRASSEVGTDLDRIRQRFPHLLRGQILAALAFAEDCAMPSESPRV